MSLPADLEQKYKTIIDAILAVSDLQSVSVKLVRTGLQDAIDEDITDKKKEINELIRKRFDNLAAETNITAEVPASSPPVNGSASPVKNGTTTTNSHAPPSPSESTPTSPPTKQRTPTEELSDVADEPRPKKKLKRSVSDDDAAFAARLQAEENNRSRPTRGGPTKKRAPLKKKVVKKKNKSAAKINSDDDSVDGSGSEDNKPKTGAFHKPFNLSPPLQELLGETQLSRPQTVKKIWAYVKARDLQKPTDKRQIMCDEPMRAVFKADSVHMFTMNKILNTHLYPVDE